MSVRKYKTRNYDSDCSFYWSGGVHSKAHTEFNDAWRSDDYNLDRFQAWLARRDDVTS